MNLQDPGEPMLEFSNRAQQVLNLAQCLERRYKGYRADNDNYFLHATENGASVDDFQMLSLTLLEHEERVKTGLIELIGGFEDCVNNLMTNCTINFSSTKNECSTLFIIWTTIRKISDIVRNASFWDGMSSNDGQMGLNKVEVTINETLLFYICQAQQLLFKNAIQRLLNDCAAPVRVPEQYAAQLDTDIDSQTQNVVERLVSMLDFFHDCVDRVKEGPLSVWKREQKKAMFGIDLTEDMAQDLSVTKPAIALKTATTEFQELSKIWLQIDRLVYMCCFNRWRSAIYNKLEEKLKGCAEHLLQSSLVVDWRYNNLCQPHIVVRSQAKEYVSIFVKVLAAVDSFCVPEFAQPQFLPLISASRSKNITAEFVKPTNKSAALSEYIAIQLRDNTLTLDQRRIYIENAGRITSDQDAMHGVLQAKAVVDLNDQTVGAEFSEVIFVLGNSRRHSKTPIKLNRYSRTKYNIEATATVTLNSDMARNSSTGGWTFPLKTLSTPFCCAVASTQDKKLYEDFLWHLLAAPLDSVSCHCQPMTEEEKDLPLVSLVYWGDYKTALKWLFYKLTHSRILRDDELNHLGSRLLGKNNPPNYLTFDYQRGKPGNPDFSRIRTEKPEKRASFFHWYFEAIELIKDTNDSIAQWRTHAKPDVSKLTMSKLFETGIVLGFINRQGSEQLLKASDENAMIIRFSDRKSGCLTISYIKKQTESRPEKLEHIHSPYKTQFVGMGLSMTIALLINLKEVRHIIVSRLVSGEIYLKQECLRDKDELIHDHLSYFEDGQFANDPDGYARIMLNAQQSDTIEATSSVCKARPHRSPTAPSFIRNDSEHDTLFVKHRKNPRMTALLNELEAEEASSCSTARYSPCSPTALPCPLCLASTSTTVPNSMMQQIPSMASTGQSYNQVQSPSVPGFAAQPGQITQGSTIFMPLSSCMSSPQHSQMPIQPLNATLMSFPSTSLIDSQSLTPYLTPTNGMQMMQPQQQIPITENEQQIPWLIHSQTPNFSNFENSQTFVQNGANMIQSYRPQQYIDTSNQSEMQQMNLSFALQQQQPQRFARTMNQYQPQLASQPMVQNQSMQPQVLQQQLMPSTMILQQQGMMLSSFAYQPQQQFYPQFESQPQPMLTRHSHIDNVTTTQPSMSPNTQGKNH